MMMERMDSKLMKKLKKKNLNNRNNIVALLKKIR